MKKFNFSERNKYNQTLAGIVIPIRPMEWRYRIHGQNLWFMPLPPSGTIIQVWMAPRLLPLVNPTDELPVGLIEGWEELPIIDACIQVKIKTEEDATELKALKAETIMRIKEAATNRDIASPSTVVDSYAIGGPGLWP